MNADIEIKDKMRAVETDVTDIKNRVTAPLISKNV